MRWCRGCQKAVTPGHPGYEFCKTPKTFNFHHDVNETMPGAVQAAQNFLAQEQTGGTMKFTIQTTQEFNVTYEVEADNAHQAWMSLLDGNGEGVDQQPGNIIGTEHEAHIEEAV